MDPSQLVTLTIYAGTTLFRSRSGCHLDGRHSHATGHSIGQLFVCNSDSRHLSRKRVHSGGSTKACFRLPKQLVDHVLPLPFLRFAILASAEAHHRRCRTILVLACLAQTCLRFLRIAKPDGVLFRHKLSALLQDVQTTTKVPCPDGKEHEAFQTSCRAATPPQAKNIAMPAEARPRLVMIYSFTLVLK